MDFELKWFAIMMIGMMLAAAIGTGIEDYGNSQVAVAAAEAGLEECPNKDSRKGDTIWVKNCREYLEIEVKGSE